MDQDTRFKMKIIRSLLVAVAAFFIACCASAQNVGTVTSHAFAIGKGPGTQGFTSLLCGSAQLAVGQSAADPICKTLTGDVTLSAAGATTIGANKVTLGMMATLAADNLIGNPTGSTATPQAFPLVNCANALTYSTSSHTFGCNSTAGTGTVITSGSPAANQLAMFTSATAITGVTRAQPVVCEIISTSATTCNNGGGAANNGTYTTPTGALYLKLTIIGGGGGGGGSGTAGGGAGTAGNPSCWNTSGAACTTPVYQAGGGGAGSWATPAGPAGGSVSGSGTCAVSIIGESGGGQVSNSTIALALSGPYGGSTILGGGGRSGQQGVAGSTAVTNTGGGGQGGGTNTTTANFSGTGGGAGATCVAFISSPAASYTYAVGALANGGTAGTNGFAGGGGAAGRIIAEAFYN